MVGYLFIVWIGLVGDDDGISLKKNKENII